MSREELKEVVVNKAVKLGVCPNYFGMSVSCVSPKKALKSRCSECWKMAIERKLT